MNCGIKGCLKKLGNMVGKSKEPDIRVFHVERHGGWCELIVRDKKGAFYRSTFSTTATIETIWKYTVDELLETELYPVRSSEIRRLFVRFDEDTMTRFTGELSSSTFIKRQPLKRDIHYQYYDGVAAISHHLLKREIMIMEIIRKCPHPAIAEYLGVWTDPALGGRYVTDIVYKRYDCDLLEFYTNKDNRTPENGSLILDRVAAGVDHLHYLQIAHHDLRPDNIFLKYEAQESGINKVTEVVIGDFDAAMKFGSRGPSFKHAPSGLWWDRSLYREGNPVNGAPDRYSVKILEKWLAHWLRQNESFTL